MEKKCMTLVILGMLLMPFCHKVEESVSISFPPPPPTRITQFDFGLPHSSKESPPAAQSQQSIKGQCIFMIRINSCQAGRPCRWLPTQRCHRLLPTQG